MPEEYRTGYLFGVRQALREAPDLESGAPEFIHEKDTLFTGNKVAVALSQHLSTLGGCKTRRGGRLDTSACFPYGVTEGSVVLHFVGRTDGGTALEFYTPTAPSGGHCTRIQRKD